MQFVLPKDKTLPELQTIVNSFDAIAESRSGKAKVLRKVTNSAISLIQSETPQFEQMLTYSLGQFNEIASSEDTLSLSEMRFKDDMLDIVERYRVITKLEKAYTDSIAEIERTKNLVQEIETSIQLESGSQKQKLLESLQNAKLSRNNAISNAKKVTKKLIQAKRKFSKFKVNRLRHGWRTYSEALRVCAEQQEDLYQSIISSLADIRSRIDDVCEQKNAPNEQMMSHQFDECDVPDDVKNLKNPFEDIELS
ncbi:hypothetical protein GPJ56_003136 [Histomonas meleagridis]|uniref:uncharacterized protein n=1 Tax=Histomonas meleagridis TaxID=135588 RepID=UPI0035597B8A|nr:hypothetical protein GPJ56_003136 [Histomonas meleagridis]KAH0801169.1 hypothetical protein GO595_005764 [Histomonas meleagridis]